jgi:hypothetical protein
LFLTPPSYFQSPNSPNWFFAHKSPKFCHFEPNSGFLKRIFVLWKATLDAYKFNDIFITRGKEMGSRVKPVQPTEIKDKKIAREVIEQIRKPIPASVYKRHEKQAAYIDKFFK